ncbi:hypothetical protein HGRIS_014536 [Hohenbuehelia grisea]|uniref:Glycosyl transferase CAP10 domain-containing protein n=1 Tax=Hohenbuehelia grisea TaxID=104357 RepID=A0ABR3JTX7_9AGAR
MSTLYHPRRSLNRPIFVIFGFGLVVFLVSYINDLIHDSYHEHSLGAGGPLTVIQTSTVTAWAQTTRTIASNDAEATPTSKAEGLQMHEYRSDGLLEVNPKAPHPISELIALAEASWEGKLDMASKTLEEAVAEYKRRYKRPPPRGFDKWWKYAQEHNVQLPDEYDQIHRDLEPFWGVNPIELQHIQRDWEASLETYTIGKEGGPLSVLNSSFPSHFTQQHRDRLMGGAYEFIDLLKDIGEHLPPFRAVFSPHDNPNHLIDFELMSSALAAAEDGGFVDLSIPPAPKLRGWISACDPSSDAWAEPIDFFRPPPPQIEKTFIYDHRGAMDPCQHPALLRLHGQFLSHGQGPVAHSRLVPAFSYSPTLLHYDITVASPFNWVEDIEPRDADPPWDSKHDERLLWRGSNTGIWHARDKPWRNSQRDRLVHWANGGFKENISVLVPPEDEAAKQKDSKRWRPSRGKVGEAASVRKSLYAPALLDISFAGEMINCAPGTCEEIQRVFEFRKHVDLSTAGQYKYVLDVDGNGWSSRFKRLITSNSLVFKSTVYPEWFTDRIAPWVHYIPVQVDYSDLMDALVFFRGDLDGRGRHDELARKIALAGREWSKAFWRKEDLTAYMFR